MLKKEKVIDSLPNFTIEQMLKSSVHFGHRVNARNPKMSHNIYRSYQGIHIIDVRKTYNALSRAIKKIYHDAKGRKSILFVGTNPKYETFLSEAAKSSGQHYICQWSSGMLTNWRTIVASIKSLKKHNDIIANIEKTEEIDRKITKKEMGKLVKKRDVLNRRFGGIVEMKGMPDLIILMSAKQDHVVVEEAKAIGIPIIAIVDTDANTDNIAYPVPGNDDAIKSIRFFLDIFVESIIAGIKDDVDTKLEKKTSSTDEKNQPEANLKSSLKTKSEKSIDTSNKLEKNVN